MKIGICFSGMCRSLEFVHESIKKHLIHSLEKEGHSVEIFAAVLNNEDSFKAKKYLNFDSDKILYVNEVQHSVSGPVNDNTKTGWKKLGHQLNDIERSNNLRIKWQKENNVNFDAVIRSRLDVLYLKDVKIKNIDLNFLNTPDFHNWSHVLGGGYNDRFVISNQENMNKFTKIYQPFLSYCSSGKPVHAESFIFNHVKTLNLDVKENAFRFKRVRKDGKVLDHFLDKDKADWDWYKH
jgi:hypothetical protein